MDASANRAPVSKSSGLAFAKRTHVFPGQPRWGSKKKPYRTIVKPGGPGGYQFGTLQILALSERASPRGAFSCEGFHRGTVPRRSLMRAAVIGAGSWGTALASVLGSNGHETYVWSHDPEVALAINERHENRKYLPDLPLPDTV